MLCNFISFCPKKLPYQKIWFHNIKCGQGAIAYFRLHKRDQNLAPSRDVLDTNITGHIVFVTNHVNNMLSTHALHAPHCLLDGQRGFPLASGHRDRTTWSPSHKSISLQPINKKRSSTCFASEWYCDSERDGRICKSICLLSGAVNVYVAISINYWKWQIVLDWS